MSSGLPQGDRRRWRDRIRERRPRARRHEPHLIFEMIRVRRFERRCVELYSAPKSTGSSIAHRRGGDRRWSDVHVRSRRCSRGDLSGKRPYAGPRGHCPGRDGRMFGQRRRMQSRPRRIDAPLRRGHRCYGGDAIVGGGLPVATGLALAGAHPEVNGIMTACFFGEGAMAEGDFHDA